MRTPIVIAIFVALVTAGVLLFFSNLLLDPDRPLVAYIDVSPTTISPNADGVDDVALVEYEITRNATVSFLLVDSNDNEFYFREGQNRAEDEYQVQFSGVVDGYVLPDETVFGQIIRRLIPNGVYTWVFRAIAEDDGEEVVISGDITINDADAMLPDLVEFSVAPDVFTPNQDGIDDRTQINVAITKDAELNVYLLDQEGNRVYMARRGECRELGEAGRHCFDYEGGVDLGADPPPDGEYTVVAVAQDEEGQIIRREQSLVIQDGGKPRAEIVPQVTGATVIFESLPYEERFYSDAEALGDLVEAPDDSDSVTMNAITMQVGDMLVFKLTVNNYGPTPIRTAGPWPGTVYQQMQSDASLGEYERSGVWRVGIECETSVQSYPWRWAIGSQDSLEVVEAPDGELFYYLPAETRAVTWGAIRLTEISEAQNPQNCWAGLIHEDVAITLLNRNVGPREIELVDPTAQDSENSTNG